MRYLLAGQILNPEFTQKLISPYLLFNINLNFNLNFNIISLPCHPNIYVRLKTENSCLKQNISEKININTAAGTKPLPLLKNGIKINI